MTVMRIVLVLLGLVTVGCVPKPRCDFSSCSGCCDAMGTCQLGASPLACGAKGSVCGSCGLGLSCSDGRCEAPTIVNPGVGGGLVSMTGGGSSGTGGGTVSMTGGGFVAQTSQELVSGTRLKAIHLTGTDGSKAPLGWGLNASAVFWDSQLMLYCVPVAQNTAAALCEPLGLGYTNETSGDYADSACTIGVASANNPADLNSVLSAAGLPTTSVTHVRLNGSAGRHTYFTAVPVSPGAPRYFKSASTACMPSGTFSEGRWSMGTSVPVSSFASMRATRD